ncbi:hypothetical protein BJ912DRAFT_1132893 [Pholiota molesta]|nr:hypothetical protein BJ912DRAFT_1132893 [Pholiota molesta]
MSTNPSDSRICPTKAFVLNLALMLQNQFQCVYSTKPAHSWPLVLPGDDLALDPKCPAQSLRQWLLTSEGTSLCRCASAIDSESPKIKVIVDYLTAYYHGMSVKNLPPSTLKFASWDRKTEKKAPRYVGLNTLECIRIRTRASNDRIFDRQLNLDDLLDAAISILPEDAYALVLLVDHDLYESAEDEFVCGRAYGGSRVAVISSASIIHLDAIQGVERDHAWPASHWKLMSGLAVTRPRSLQRKESKSQLAATNEIQHVGSPIHAALIAHQSLPSLDNRRQIHTRRSMARPCSASLKEDARQPPYLCPVDLAKMISATQTTPGERYRAILAFCAKHEGVHLFDAFRAWIGGRLEEFVNPDS